jgi:uncharacterized membrane protein YdjX (TVP38/TMEM64 family)
MKRYWSIAILMLAFFLTLFLIVEALHIPILTDPSRWLERGGAFAAAVGVTLLIADVVLPVPSSLVMIAHGALFGVIVGTILSLVGSVGATLVGFAIGRRGGVMLERIVSSDERARADRMLARWGALFIVVTRPVPLLAETVAILAGASSISWKSAGLAAVTGSLPPALLYALTGSVAASFQNGALMFALILLVSGSFWYISYRIQGSGADDQLTR